MTTVAHRATEPHLAPAGPRPIRPGQASRPTGGRPREGGLTESYSADALAPAHAGSDPSRDARRRVHATAARPPRRVTVGIRIDIVGSCQTAGSSRSWDHAPNSIAYGPSPVRRPGS